MDERVRESERELLASLSEAIVQEDKVKSNGKIRAAKHSQCQNRSAWGICRTTYSKLWSLYSSHHCGSETTPGQRSQSVVRKMSWM